ncbi:MAG TPA: hypothetical protein EYP14_15325 [Planctomycetaceae bacterium]|nr:hypothetical protein [Planctomycetaceae bacterium]
MESIRRVLQQFVELYRAMSPSQRATLVIVPLVVVVGLGVVMFTGTSKSYVALSWGKVFTTEELIDAEQTLIQAGLTEFRREGHRLLVPAGEVDRYNAALIADGTLPSNSVSEWEKQFEKSNSFTSRRQLEELKEIALRKEMRRVLRAVPAIEDATVFWARTEDRSPFRRKPKVTATVTVRPRSGRELSVTLIESLRNAVANMIPDLKPEDVTIFDQSTGMAHTAPREGDPFDSRLLAKIRQFEQAEYQKIAHALSTIDNVLVTVSVDLDNLQRHVERTRTIEKPIEVRSSVVTKESQVTRPATGGEVGVNSNAPRNLNVAATSGPAETSTENKSETVSVPSSIVDTEKVYTAAMPQAVRVTVSIPDDYYRAIAAKQGLSEGESDQEKAAFKKALNAIEQQEVSRVQAIVRTLLPKDTPPDAVTVRTYVRLPEAHPEPVTPWFYTVVGVLSRWGSAIGLGVFALWALWMLNKSVAKTPVPEAPATVADLVASLEKEDEETEQEKRPEQLSKRDRLQMAVRDNPEVAAAVLGKWLRSAVK